jgi:tetratricopeptide (TPR) repeat protein
MAPWVTRLLAPRRACRIAAVDAAALGGPAAPSPRQAQCTQRWPYGPAAGGALGAGGWAACLLAVAVVWLAARTAPAQAQQRQPNLLRQAYELSQRAATIDEFTRIVELCEEGLKTEPQETLRDYGRRLAAWACNKRGELRVQGSAPDEAEALNDFQRAVQYDPTNWRYLHNRGVSLGALGRLDEALADFNQVIRAAPDFARAYYNRGEIHYARGDYSAALRDYTECLRRQRNDSAAYNSRGFTYYTLGNYAAAVADYTQAIAIDRNVEAYVNRGDAYADQARFSEALRDYTAALSQDPRFGRAHQSLAWLRATCPVARFRDPAQAVQSARRAIELDGESHRYLDTLAAALARAGQYDSAVQAQEQALAAARQADEPSSLIERYEFRLRRYRDGKPYVDVAAGTPQPE